MFWRIAIGRRNHSANRDISKVETGYSDTIQHAAVTNSAPITFIDPVSHSAKTDPSCPPAGIALAIGRQLGAMPSAVEDEATSRMDPMDFAQGEIHRIH